MELTTWLILIGFFLGSTLGSFALVLAERSLVKKSFWGRSSCPNCHKKLPWYDLLPIFSYLFLQAKCRFCKKKISLDYLLIEVAVGILIALLFFQERQTVNQIINLSGQPINNFQSVVNIFFTSVIFFLALILKILFITSLITLFVTDLRKMLIPDRVVLPVLLISFIISLINLIFKISYLYYFLSQTVLGKYLLPPHTDYFQRHAFMLGQEFLFSLLSAILIGGFFLSLIIITKGKGMGGGDVKLGVLIGLILGFPNGLLAIVISFIIGAVFSLGLIVFRKKHFGQTIPFGPFLVTGSLISLYFGSQIIDWYLRLRT